MQYTINNSIVFDSGDGTLRHAATNDIVQLPLPAQRLLQILLESKCEILTRDFLFKEVWDKYGLTGSNSNLNQYLSLLRRSMLVFGCDNFVITIPKVGIKLNEQNDIIKTVIQQNNLPIKITEYDGAQSKSKNEKISLSKINFIFLMAFGVIIISTILILNVRNTQRDPIFTSHTLKSGCIIQTVKSEDEYYHEKIENQVLNILKENNLICRKGVNIYFDYYASTTPQTYGRTMLSLCRLGSNGVNIACNNVFYFNRDEVNE